MYHGVVAYAKILGTEIAQARVPARRLGRVQGADDRKELNRAGTGSHVRGFQ